MDEDINNTNHSVLVIDPSWEYENNNNNNINNSSSTITAVDIDTKNNDGTKELKTSSHQRISVVETMDNDSTGSNDCNDVVTNNDEILVNTKKTGMQMINNDGNGCNDNTNNGFDDDDNDLLLAPIPIPSSTSTTPTTTTRATHTYVDDTISIHNNENSSECINNGIVTIDNNDVDDPFSKENIVLCNNNNNNDNDNTNYDDDVHAVEDPYDNNLKRRIIDDTNVDNDTMKKEEVEVEAAAVAAVDKSEYHLKQEQLIRPDDGDDDNNDDDDDTDKNTIRRQPITTGTTTSGSRKRVQFASHYSDDRDNSQQQSVSSSFSSGVVEDCTNRNNESRTNDADSSKGRNPNDTTTTTSCTHTDDDNDEVTKLKMTLVHNNSSEPTTTPTAVTTIKDCGHHRRKKSTDYIDINTGCRVHRQQTIEVIHPSSSSSLLSSSSSNISDDITTARTKKHSKWNIIRKSIKSNSLQDTTTINNDNNNNFNNNNKNKVNTTLDEHNTTIVVIDPIKEDEEIDEEEEEEEEEWIRHEHSNEHMENIRNERGEEITRRRTSTTSRHSLTNTTMWTNTTRQYRVRAGQLNCYNNNNINNNNNPSLYSEEELSNHKLLLFSKTRSVLYLYTCWSRRIANRFNDHIRWTFKASFLHLLLVSFIYYAIVALFFTMLIFWVAQHQPECIFAGGSGKPFLSYGSDWVDALQLSWTTLSTVGYGIIGPETPTDDYRCVGINMLMAIESFVGVLFGSVTGAVIFGKIARIQSVAHVQFSYPICIRYGKGVVTRTATNGTSSSSQENDSDSNCSDDEEENKKYPCPILEFRVINEMSRERDGEIRNATVTVVASMDAITDEENISSRRTSPASARRASITSKISHVSEAAAHKVVEATKIVGKGTGSVIAGAGMATAKVASSTGTAMLGAGKRAAFVLHKMKHKSIMIKDEDTIQDTTESSISETNHHDTISSPSQKTHLLNLNEIELNQMIEAECQRRIEQLDYEKKKKSISEDFSTRSIRLDEGDSILAPPRIYHKLEIESDTHPFFKRCWNIRHVLDAQSPLLTRKARLAIERNNGYWPSKWNDYNFVREHLKFKQIIVSFRGTANVSANSVYAQKIYEFEQVAVGYTFANVIFLENGVMAVDEALLNDVKEQYGGGAEPWDTTNQQISTSSFYKQHVSISNHKK